MKRYIKWFLIAVLSFIVMIFIFILIRQQPVNSFTIVFNGAYIIKLIMFPFYTAIEYIDIIYFSIGIFFILAVVSLFLIKKYYKITRNNLTLLFSFLISCAGVSSYYEAEIYIKKIAQDRYHITPCCVEINMSIWWMPINIFNPPSYTKYWDNKHASVEVNNTWYHWSFRERDFVKDQRLGQPNISLAREFMYK